MRGIREQVDRARSAVSGVLPEKLRIYLFKSFRNYSTVFGSEEGKWVLADMARACEELRSARTVGDPYAIHYYEGMRDLWRRCMNRSGMGLVDIHAKIKELETQSDEQW